MKPMNRLSLTAFTLAALTAGVWAQTQTASNAVPAAPAAATPSPASPVVTVADIQALKDALAAQQQQIQALQEQLQRKNEALQPVQPSVGEPATPDAAPAPSPQPVAALGVTGIQQENTASPAPKVL